jgi:hypothetical protein
MILLFLGQPRCSREYGGRETHAGAEASVFLLELGNSALEIGELGLTAVSGILSSDTIAVSTGLLALLCGHVSASAFAGGTRLVVRGGREREGGRVNGHG